MSETPIPWSVHSLRDGDIGEAGSDVRITVLNEAGEPLTLSFPYHRLDQFMTVLMRITHEANRRQIAAGEVQKGSTGAVLPRAAGMRVRAAEGGKPAAAIEILVQFEGQPMGSVAFSADPKFLDALAREAVKAADEIKQRSQPS